MSEEKKEKDSGMKWVIVADIMIAVVVLLLLWASFIERNLAKEQYAKNANDLMKDAVQVADIEAKKSYDFDLDIKPSDCQGVEGKVDVMLISDANYMEFTRVAILSAIKNKCPLTEYNFHIMTMDLEEGDDVALKNLETDGAKIFLYPQKEIDLFYIRDTHVSKTSLLKYYIADVLKDLDKVIYIDSDVLVLQDLNKLYNTDVEGKYLAAVKDPSWFFENGHVLELNLEERGFYFNSGVMLMNLKKIRDDNLVAKLEDYTNNNFRTYMDQDALNVVVGNDVLLLDVEYNTMNFFFAHNPLNVLSEFYGKNWSTLEEVFSNAAILHFASSKKPLGTVVEKTDFFFMLQKLWYRYYGVLSPLS